MAQQPMSKVERYRWGTLDMRGEARDIPLSMLQVDHTYQRDKVSKTNILAMAADFSWEAFGRITVFERSDGSLYIVDGQHRFLAAQHRKDIDKVPCEVFQSAGQEQEREAAAFYGANVRRRNVSSFDKFKARVQCNAEPETEISKWCRKNGFVVSGNAGASDVIQFPDKLVRHWKADAKAAQRALLIQREIVEPEKLSVYIHSGIWWLLRNGVDVAFHAARLRQFGGSRRLLNSINARSNLTGVGRGSEKLCGEGVLEVLNYYLRKKIRLQNTD